MEGGRGFEVPAAVEVPPPAASENTVNPLRSYVNIENQKIEAPELRVRGGGLVNVESETGEWSFGEKSVVHAYNVYCWALVDFTEGELQLEAFVRNLMRRSLKLGIRMSMPSSIKRTGMQSLSSVDMVEEIFTSIASNVHKARKKLQLIVIAVSRMDPAGYKYIRWVSETRIGVLTQGCSSELANKGEDQYLTHIALNINAKLGGTNFVVPRLISTFNQDVGVLLAGAAVSVSHPDTNDKSYSSTAAVVGAMNWPSLTRYVAKVCPQDGHCKAINNLGGMCLQLVISYNSKNEIWPDKIVLFRDGGSDMDLRKELSDLYTTLHTLAGDYKPRITLIVAQQQPKTRLQDLKLQLGMVADTGLFHPGTVGFYLCSQPEGNNYTHYRVFSDDNEFKSDELKRLIYDMSFTFQSQTKPASLVPPAYYARCAAQRLQLYLEVAAEKGIPPTTHHSDLANTMFYL